MNKSTELFTRKFRRNLLLIFNMVWVFPCIVIIYLIRPLVFVRFHGIYASRIGNFISEVAEQLNSIKYKSKNEVRLFYYINSKEISNSQWQAMVNRTIPVHQYFAYNVGKWLGYLSGHSSRHVNRPNPDPFFWRKNPNYHHDISIKFNADEMNTAKNWLKSFGWQESEPFVCLNVRDSAYLRSDPVNSPYFSKNERWKTLDFRNSEIETYIEGINFLNTKGVWVLRMGKIMNNPAPYSNAKFIDYAFLKSRSDLLDIWLYANCAGIISTASGPDLLGVVYSKPILFLNALPLDALWAFHEMIWVPKHLIWKSSRKKLSLREHLDNSLSTGRLNMISHENIEVVDLDSHEIYLAVNEWWSKFFEQKNENPVISELQVKFWEIFCGSQNYKSRHGWRNIKASVGSDWLISQENDFFDE